jgi:hypothetical protein
MSSNLNITAGNLKYGRSTSLLHHLICMIDISSRENRYSPTFHPHDMQTTGKARTTPSRSPDCMYWRIVSNASMSTPIDCLVEETETHILVGLFLFCKLYQHTPRSIPSLLITYPLPWPLPWPPQQRRHQQQLHRKQLRHHHRQLRQKERRPTCLNPQ